MTTSPWRSAGQAGCRGAPATGYRSASRDGARSRRQRGTTLTATCARGQTGSAWYIGDSRGYSLRDGELTQITKDDTLVQTLVDEGRITSRRRASHPQRSLIMRALIISVEPTLTRSLRR